MKVGKETCEDDDEGKKEDAKKDDAKKSILMNTVPKLKKYPRHF